MARCACEVWVQVLAPRCLLQVRVFGVVVKLKMKLQVCFRHSSKVHVHHVNPNIGGHPKFSDVLDHLRSIVRDTSWFRTFKRTILNLEMWKRYKFIHNKSQWNGFCTFHKIKTVHTMFLFSWLFEGLKLSQLVHCWSALNFWLLLGVWTLKTDHQDGYWTEEISDCLLYFLIILSSQSSSDSFSEHRLLVFVFLGNTVKQTHKCANIWHTFTLILSTGMPKYLPYLCLTLSTWRNTKKSFSVVTQCGWKVS